MPLCTPCRNEADITPQPPPSSFPSLDLGEACDACGRDFPAEQRDLAQMALNNRVP